MYVMRCNDCGTIAREEDFVFDEAKRENSCPNCMEWENLQDLNSECSFRNYELIDLYRLFQDVHGYEGKYIDDNFMDFPAGTSVAEIDEWFGERYDGGIEELREIAGG